MSTKTFNEVDFNEFSTAREKVEFLDDIENFCDDTNNLNDKTSNCATFWNICNTIQGLPILTVPYIVLVGGWYSLLAICIVAVLTDYSCVLLYESLREHNSKLSFTSPYIATSYEDLGGLAFGSHGRKLLSGCMFIQTLAISSIYPLLVGSMLNAVFKNQYMYLWEWIVIGSIFFIPSSFVKNLEQVSWTSIVTVVTAKIVFVVLIVYSIQLYQSWTIINLSDFDLYEFPGAIAILLSCYLTQPFVPSICTSMENPKNFKYILHSAIISMTLLNLIVGMFGDAAFRPNTKQPVTNNLPDGMFRLFLNTLGTILALTSFTLPIFTAFGVFERFMCYFFDTERLFIERPTFEIHKFFLVIFSIAIAAFLPGLPLLLSLVSSTAGIGLEFIFPPLIYIKICGTLSKNSKNLGVWSLCLLGIILMIGFMFLTGVAIIHSLHNSFSS